MPVASPFRTLDDLLAAFKARPGVDLVGRRLGRRQRPDPRRPHRGRRRRRAAARQLHRLLGRRRGAGGDPRRPSVRRHQRSRGVRGADRGRNAARARRLERRALARRRCADVARARRRRRARELALGRRAARHHGRRARAARRRRRGDGALESNGASCSRASAGSIAISPATSSRHSRRPRSGACARSCASSAPARAPAKRRAAEPYAAFVLAGLATIWHRVGRLPCAARASIAPARGAIAWRPLGADRRGGAALHVLLAESAGFIVAAAVLFWLVARAFDARQPVRDAGCALGVAAASYALFALRARAAVAGRRARRAGCRRR